MVGRGDPYVGNKRSGAWQRYRELLWSVLLIGGLSLLYFSQSTGAFRQWRVLDKAVVTILSPISWVIVHTTDSVQSTWRKYVDLVDTHVLNERLVEENGQLRQEVQRLEALKHENHRLRALMGMATQVEKRPTLAATVIAASMGSLERTLRLDRGAQHGVFVGAAVVTDRGVVGRVGAVTPWTSEVILGLDPNSSTDIGVQRTRTWGRVTGMDERRVNRRAKRKAGHKP